MKRKGKIAAAVAVAAALIASGVAYVATDNTPAAGDRVTLLNEQCALGDFEELQFTVPASGRTAQGIVRVGEVPLSGNQPPTEKTAPIAVTAMGDAFVFRGLSDETDPTFGDPSTKTSLVVGRPDREGEMTIDVVTESVAFSPVDGLASDKWEPGDRGQFAGDMQACWLGEDS